MQIAIPYKLQLDNAANIYPASMTKRYSSLYRISVTLRDTVDETILQTALNHVSERIPTFRCTLARGMFWWYLRQTGRSPRVRPLKPLHRFRLADQGGLLYRVSADGRRIVLDVFHALTDGNGAMTFLLTLTGEYLRLRYGIQIGWSGQVLNPEDRPDFREWEDSFKTVFTGRRGQLEKNVDAYHIKGRALGNDGLIDSCLEMPREAVRVACRKFDCSTTELFTSLMLYSLQELYLNDPKAKHSALKVSVPVNLRPIYRSRTLRNFASYVNIGFDAAYGERSLRRIVSHVKAQKAHDLLTENLEPKIAANVHLEEKLLVRCLPLSVKHPIIDIINLLHGDRYYSQTLSNLGEIKVPQQMQPYIEFVDFVLGRQRGNSGACTCTVFGDKVHFHLSRKIVDDRFEQIFIRLLGEIGITYSLTTTRIA